jgi:hypothetical protein
VIFFVTEVEEEEEVCVYILLYCSRERMKNNLEGMYVHVEVT